MKSLALAMLLLAACSTGNPGRGGNTNGGTNGGTTGGTTGGTNGGTTGGNPDMAQPLGALDTDVVVNGAPSDAPSRFAGAPDATAAPVMVYPPDGVMVPPNINELEIQFTPAAGTTLFQISFVGPGVNLRVYTPCVPIGAGCGYKADQMTWDTLLSRARGNVVAITIKAVNAAGGVGASELRKIAFADEDLLGGLYYWAASSGAINRYDFGMRGQQAEPFYTTAMSGAICVGCHALSRDGSRIAVGLNTPGPATLRMLDVASRQQLFQQGSMIGGLGGGGGSNFEALTPDGAKVLTSEGGNLVLRDAQTGTPLNATVQGGTMPDFSTDGTTVVFARENGANCPLGLCGLNPAVEAASLYITSFNGTSFGAPTQLTQGGSGNNHYYPTYAPDGAWVAFNRSAGQSFDAMDAQVKVVSSAGGVPVDLAAVNDVKGNSWPKFAPFISHFQGKTIFWLTFSSRRDYGLRLMNSTASGDRIAQIWMVAVSPDRLKTAGDGGYPGFWLPFQDMSTGNHIAQWTQDVQRQGCSNDGQCIQGEFCVGGECLPPIM